MFSFVKFYDEAERNDSGIDCTRVIFLSFNFALFPKNLSKNLFELISKSMPPQ
jgi:hypothetical protein